MGWVMPAMMGASALMGGMGGKGKSKDRTTTQTSQRDPWNQGYADEGWGNYMDASRQAGGINWGPSGAERRLFRGMMGQYGPGAGGGGGGGGGMAGQMGGRRRGGGGGGRPKFGKYAGQNVEWNPYESRVLGEDYLDVASDPYIQSQQQYRRGLFDENSAASRTAAMSPFIQAGGSMGLTGAAMGQQGRMQQGQERDWLGMENEMFLGERANRMGQQTAANQAWSGRESAFDSSAIGGEAQMAAARAAAAAQRYSADQQLRGTMAGVGAQSAANRFAQQQAMFGMAGQMADKRRQGQGLGAMGLWGQNLNQQLPWQSNFGRQTSTGTTPGQGSAFGNFLQGAGGGAMQGFGMYKNMGSPQNWAQLIGK